MGTDNDAGVSRRAALRTAAMTAGAAGLMGAMVTAGAVREAGADQGDIVGSWINRSTRNGRVAIATFLADGGWINAHPNVARRSAAHGAWVKTGDRSYTVTRWSLRFDEHLQMAGTVRTRATAVLSARGDTLTSRRVSEFFDLAGALVYKSPIVESQSTRIRIERGLG
jgi:hypothetical protein